MNLPTIEVITNLYLYGIITKPSDLESDVLLRSDSPIKYDVDINEFMNSVGRFVSAANFTHVRDFMRKELKLNSHVSFPALLTMANKTICGQCEFNMTPACFL